jgi:hypothetical protein
MSDPRDDILDYIRRHPGQTEKQIAAGLYGKSAYQQQVNKHLLSLRIDKRARREGRGGNHDAFRSFVVED